MGDLEDFCGAAYHRGVTPDDLAELCEWDALFVSDEAADRALLQHVAFHVRQYTESLIAAAVLHRAKVVGWGALTEREREILRAYSLGADLL